jgi:hypothetical protein
VTDSSVGSEPADFAIVLAAHAQSEVADRERNFRRTIVAVAVLILHVLAISVFIYSSRIPLVQRIRTTIPEAIMWLVLPSKPVNPVMVKPVLPEEPLPQVTAPITVPPITARPLPAAPPSEGMLGVGRSLACGASSYENLSPAQREDCRRHPWHFVKRPDGTIVLDVPKPVEPPPASIDVLRHEQQTAPPCPILSNVPCLGKVMHGDPSGAAPQPF